MDDFLRDSNEDIFWNQNTNDEFLLNLSSIEELNKEDFEWLGFGNLHLNINSQAPNADVSTINNKKTEQTTATSENETKLLNFEQNIQQEQKTQVKEDEKRVLTIEQPKQNKLSNKLQLKKLKSKVDTKSNIFDRHTIAENLKKASLKRSRKRSKAFSTTNQITSTNSTIQFELTQVENNEKQLQEKTIKAQTSQFVEPQHKKFALDNQKMKNVDIQIEKFSLLDLHSSEDECLLLKKPNMINTETSKRAKYSITTTTNEKTINIDEKAVKFDNTFRAPAPLTTQKSETKLENLLKSLNTNMANTQHNNNSKRKKLVQSQTELEDMNAKLLQKNLLNLDINSNSEDNFLASSCSSSSSGSINKFTEADDEININFNVNKTKLSNLTDNPILRKKLWTMLKNSSTNEEIINELGPVIHEKLSFWDLVKIKLKYGNDKLKTTYDIIDDYTLLYSNMSKLLENFVKEHSNSHQQTSSKRHSDNSSRSRSSSRNYRKSQPLVNNQQQQQIQEQQQLAKK